MRIHLDTETRLERRMPDGKIPSTSFEPSIGQSKAFKDATADLHLYVDLGPGGTAHIYAKRQADEFPRRLGVI